MNYKQQYLASLPSLADNNFNKSIVYVDNHDGDGARGWIINKELDNRVSVRSVSYTHLTLPTKRIV